MTESILVRIRRNSVQALAEAVQAWPTDQFDGDRADDVREAIRACRSWPDEFTDILDSIWLRMRAHLSDMNFQETGEWLLGLIDQALQTLDRLNHLAQGFAQRGQTIPRAAQLGEIAEKLRRFRQQFRENWFWVDDGTLEESRAEYERGDYQTVQEILNELQGKTP